MQNHTNKSDLQLFSQIFVFLFQIMQKIITLSMLRKWVSTIIEKPPCIFSVCLTRYYYSYFIIVKESITLLVDFPKDTHVWRRFCGQKRQLWLKEKNYSRPSSELIRFIENYFRFEFILFSTHSSTRTVSSQFMRVVYVTYM